MTVLRAVPDVPARPVRWIRLVWVVWRRYRATLAGTIAILALLAGYLVLDGLHLRAAYETYHTCTPAGSANCQFAWESFRDGYGQAGLTGIVLLLLPGIVGAFFGAPLLARELETGSFRYTWTQSAGRMRWAVAMIGLGSVGVAIIMALFGLLVAWHDAPLFSSGVTQRLRSLSFQVLGPATIGWAVLGFAIGVLCGPLLRRVLAALVTAIAVWFALALATASWLRLNYLAPLTTTDGQLSAGDLVTAQWWTSQGARISDADISAALRAAGLSETGDSTAAQVGGGVDPVGDLLQHGSTQVTSYQPDGRYWTFQWLEFGWLIALGGALVAATLWALWHMGGGRGPRRSRASADRA